MGLNNKAKTVSKSNDNIPATKSKSLADELFDKSPSSKLEKSDGLEFKLNERYLNMSQQQPAKSNEDDFQFGGYVPSAISNTPRTITKRNVGFTDDIFGSDQLTSPTRPKTTSSLSNSKTEEKGSILSRTMSESKGNDDWLSIIEPKTPSKKNSNDSSLDDLLRPRSDSITRQSNIAPKQANTSDLDWLGFKGLFII